MSCFKPQGAFYLFPNVKSFYDKEANGAKIRNSYGLAYYLLKEARVAIVPGDAFGTDECIRLSYADLDGQPREEHGPHRRGPGPAQDGQEGQAGGAQQRGDPGEKAVPVEAGMDARMRDALVAEMESHLGYEGRYEWNARIGGAVVQLRTNVAHLNDFWVENWSRRPGSRRTSSRTASSMPSTASAGREPRGFYHEATQTGVLVNTDPYARSAAWPSAGHGRLDAAGRIGGTPGAVRGMSADIDGHGLVLIGPAGHEEDRTLLRALGRPAL